ncbi:hypothetical protein B0H67DRAFT_107365 [Lasiosphaeris hirsuta]|uniref:Uncharacterized protein n=1 Tax=Lasiosphaeris hirsuta TaxID=260670 RepID=A0AA40AYW0_9PEZI|nr:hypothetical protein B0H67DRAFT_107365 [Lasiosphaeris hirsuta]
MNPHNWDLPYPSELITHTPKAMFRRGWWRGIFALGLFSFVNVRIREVSIVSPNKSAVANHQASRSWQSTFQADAQFPRLFCVSVTEWGDKQTLRRRPPSWQDRSDAKTPTGALSYWLERRDRIIGIFCVRTTSAPHRGKERTVSLLSKYARRMYSTMVCTVTRSALQRTTCTFPRGKEPFWKPGVAANSLDAEPLLHSPGQGRNYSLGRSVISDQGRLQPMTWT